MAYLEQLEKEFETWVAELTTLAQLEGAARHVNKLGAAVRTRHDEMTSAVRDAFRVGARVVLTVEGKLRGNGEVGTVEKLTKKYAYISYDNAGSNECPFPSGLLRTPLTALEVLPKTDPRHSDEARNAARLQVEKETKERLKKTRKWRKDHVIILSDGMTDGQTRALENEIDTTLAQV
jgi:hypothetical protein